MQIEQLASNSVMFSPGNITLPTRIIPLLYLAIEGMVSSVFVETHI